MTGHPHDEAMLLRELLRIGEILQDSSIDQVRMLGVRVHALTRSLLDSTVVDEELLEQ